MLVEVEEAPSTTIWLRRRRRGRPPRAAPATSGQAEERIEVAPRGFFEVSRRNLWGKNRSISLFTRVSLRPRDPAVDLDRLRPITGGYGFNEYRVVGTFREPRLFDTPGDLQLTGFLEQAIRSSFNFRRRGVRLEYARRLRGASTVSGRYAFDRTRLFDEQILPEDELLIDRLFPQVRLSTLTGSVLRDSRNDVLDPERGERHRRRRHGRAAALGSEVGFVKTFVQAFVYRRLPGAAQLTLAVGVRVGLAVGFERLVARLDADGQPVLGPTGSRSWRSSTTCRQASGFSPAATTTVRGFVLDRLGHRGHARTIKAFPRAATAWSSLNRRAADARTGRVSAASGSSTPATCSGGRAT